jgi:hypothetical protein
MKRTGHRRIAIVCMALCTWIGTVQGQEASGAWRCGNTYTDQPCPGGKAIALEDARDAAQKREADRVAREARAAADRLEAERVRLESAQARRAPTLIDNKPLNAKAGSSQNTGVAQKKKKSKKESDYFSAYDPVATAKKKAAKAASKSGAKN